jgi:hypothetical protein
VGALPPDSGYDILEGVLRCHAIPVFVPKGLLYVALARAGWRGVDGPLSLDMVRRLRLADPRLSHLYLRPERDAA